MTARESPHVLLSAGGTGGHLFPAAALAEALSQRGYRLTLMTDRRADISPGAFNDVPVYRIRAGGIASGSALRRLRNAAALVFGTIETYRLMHGLRPDVAVGFGGYPSVPPLLAAARRGIPLVIHEQNAVLGRANRLLAPRAAHIALSHLCVAGLQPRDEGKARVIGNPVRPAISALATRPYPSLAADEPRRLLIIGGSQGARIFSEIVPQAVARLPSAMRAQVRIAQQCRASEMESTGAAFRALGVAAELAIFFDDMPRRLETAHLVLARAGASTISELAAAGRPAVLVPYPHAVDDHQTANAKTLAAVGGAWLVPQTELTPDGLADLLAQLFARPVFLGTAAMCARASGRRSAAHDLAGLVESVAMAATGSTPAETNRSPPREVAA